MPRKSTRREFMTFDRSSAADGKSGGGWTPANHYTNPTGEPLQLGLLHEIRDVFEHGTFWAGRTDIGLLNIGYDQHCFYATREGLRGPLDLLTESEVAQLWRERQKLLDACEHEPLMVVFIGEYTIVEPYAYSKPVGELKLVFKDEYGQRFEDETGHLFTQGLYYANAPIKHMDRTLCPGCCAMSDKPLGSLTAEQLRTCTPDRFIAELNHNIEEWAGMLETKLFDAIVARIGADPKKNKASSYIIPSEEVGG